MSREQAEAFAALAARKVDTEAPDAIDPARTVAVPGTTPADTRPERAPDAPRAGVPALTPSGRMPTEGTVKPLAAPVTDPPAAKAGPAAVPVPAGAAAEEMAVRPAPDAARDAAQRIAASTPDHTPSTPSTPRDAAPQGAGQPAPDTRTASARKEPSPAEGMRAQLPPGGAISHAAAAALAAERPAKAAPAAPASQAPPATGVMIPAAPPPPGHPVAPGTRTTPAGAGPGHSAPPLATEPQPAPEPLRPADLSMPHLSGGAGPSAPPQSPAPVYTEAALARHGAQQIAAAVTRAPVPESGRAERIELLLDPPELGRVRMTLSLGEQGVTLHLAADRPETLDLMRRHIGMLGAEFERLGYGSADFSFDGGPGSQPQARPGGGSEPAPHTTNSHAPLGAQAAASGSAARGGLDLRL